MLASVPGITLKIQLQKQLYIKEVIKYECPHKIIVPVSFSHLSGSDQVVKSVQILLTVNITMSVSLQLVLSSDYISLNIHKHCSTF